ncbi:triose-phosphate isomerase [Geosporobacter ferrireducens]|uniref:Triosephosphate isomerase n=1 Tax=Geosporobacter ferrireducens TaxID=1424294 RepID=A0A1D8GNH5_9FIRM|nr:triose-phosphate isomerase [Geosporobacter ferrireducens]AOT72427.1 triose-phosphate isomerase [Geosporobacter ferrireducens]MTI56315.1 triose-phosphate isomerase [Geosporobacter ferrireducens]
MRIPIIAGNWKMHKTASEAVQFVERIKEQVKGTDVEVVLCTPYTLLYPVKEAIKGTNIKLSAQNMHWEDQGAYTGEVSPLMLKELGVEYCIIGHSERRLYFNETDETVNKKVHAALKHNIKPIICVGETLEQRESGQTNTLVKNQVVKAFEGVPGDRVAEIVIAYEPIWAIGTGKTATSEQANEAIYNIREVIRELYGEEVYTEIRIQYGGSVKPDNIEEIMNQEDIDGALVGGASLKPDDYVALVNF